MNFTDEARERLTAAFPNLLGPKLINDIMAELAPVLEQAQRDRRVVICQWCAERLDLNGLPLVEARQRMRDHDMACPDNPLVKSLEQAQRELDEWRGYTGVLLAHSLTVPAIHAAASKVFSSCAPTEAQTPTWQPIETAPNRLVLVALIEGESIRRVSDAKNTPVGWYSRRGRPCHWATHWAPMPSWWPNGVPMESAEQAQGAQTPTCAWSMADENTSPQFWETACGHSADFTTDGVQKFCGYCGGKIVVAPADPGGGS